MYPIARKRIGAAKKIITFAFHLDRRRARVARHWAADRSIFRIGDLVGFLGIVFLMKLKAGQSFLTCLFFRSHRNKLHRSIYLLNNLF